MNPSESDHPTPDYQTGSWQARLAKGDPGLRVHLLGVGGAGLGPIARVLHEQGIPVSGSDSQASTQTEELAAMGVTVFPAQTAENLLKLAPEERPDVVLISSAISEDNPERRAAESLQIPVVKRSEFLPALLANRKLIAVAGTHGKSTTTAMIVQVLKDAGIDIGYILGSRLREYGNASAGSDPLFVLEADEYDRMFLGLNPTVAVITNVEWDHPDCYPSPASFRRAFMQFTDNVDRKGLIVSCVDDVGAEQLRAYRPTRGQWITYGLGKDADLRATKVKVLPNGGYQAEIFWWQAPVGQIALSVPGIHNLWNALAALAVARYCNVSAQESLASLGKFPGIARRFEIKGEVNGITVVDDYAHHPTEIMATLSAARNRYPDRRIWAIFQPHTFSRTKRLLYQMGESFEKADRVIVTDIYAAREQDDGTVHAKEIVATSEHPEMQYISELTSTVDYLVQHVQPGDVVITLGAGTSYKVGEWLLDRLRHSS